jgi:hypothetical protein
MDDLKKTGIRQPNATTTAAAGTAAPITTHSSSMPNIDDLFRSAPSYVHSAGGLIAMDAPDRIEATSAEFDDLIKNALKR